MQTTSSATPTNDEPQPPEQTILKKTKDTILIIFIHGFKGDEETFGGFPKRLEHILSETIEHSTVECILFPVYETKGELNEAVIRLADWLTTLTVEREVASGGGAGSAKIIFCGHSMGGLLAADTLLQFMDTRPDKTAPLWPKIIACIAFDTPYLGLHPYVFKNTATQALEYVNTAKTVGSTIFGSLAGLTAGTKQAKNLQIEAAKTGAPQSGWSRWMPAAYAAGGAVLAGAVAGGAYYNREGIGAGYTWATDHLKYVGHLWDEKALQQRVNRLVDLDEQEGIVFRTLYTYLPPSPPVHLTGRTFIVTPKSDARSAGHFIPSRNAVAKDELQAHTGMFGASTNDGYYDLGLQASKYIKEAIQLCQ